MSSADAMTEKTNKTQPKTGQRIMLAAVVLLAGAVVVLIASVVLIQDEIRSLRNTLEDFKSLQDGVTEGDDKAKSSFLTQRGITRGQDTNGKRARLSRSPQAGECELMTIPFCQNMPYTMVQYPNLLNHQTQREAVATMDTRKFERLLRSGCSPNMAPLLCSFLAPPCNGTRKPVPPCKELCKRATKSCRNELKRFGIKLHPAMRCRRLPKESGAQCFNGSWPKNTRATGCKPIMLSQCIKHTKTLPPWNAQRPNYFGHVTERDARERINQFNGLFKIAAKECSTVLAHFLCPMYAPPCNGSKPVLPPCRELCKQTRTQCKRSIKQINFHWPTDHKCKNFPRKDEAACYMGPSIEVPVTMVSRVTKSPPLGKCQVLSIPLCKSVPYNMTEFPNIFRHNTQSEASLEINQFWPLVRVNCSAELAFFLCSLYAPLCTNMLDRPPPPCRALCSRVRSGCQPLLIQYGFRWPERMACENFPERADDVVCLDTTNIAAVTTQPPLPTRERCEALDVPLCVGLHYNMTRFPNFFKHRTQSEAALEANQFLPLVRANCSSDLSQFLCSVYAPPCSGPRKPCRELCNRARQGCSPVLREFGITWPENMSCDKFPPAKGNGENCIGGSNKPRPVTKTTIPAGGKCQVLSIPLCKSVPYNMTVFPNIFHHNTQSEASLEIHQFWPLVKVNCSAELAFFLCSLYAPLCTNMLDHPPLPCRGLCSRVRSGCQPLLIQHGFRWPERMACENFPERDGDVVCLDTTNITAVTTQPPLPTRERCEALDVPLCVGLHYNMTRFPNFFKHRTQSEAALEANQFLPLVRANCSSDLSQFLCSVYAPPCSGPRKPCRELCNRARQSCSPVLREFGITWPGNMSCDKFPPAKGNGENCIGGSNKPRPISKTTIPAGERCEALNIPLCVGLHYNMTRFPNFFKHGTQAEAALEVHQFFLLVKVGCSSDLSQFLCSVYAPPCSGPRKPCRELCNRARQGCSSLMRRFGFTWPENMSCDKFPPATANGKNCIGGSPAVQSTATSTTTGQ